MSDPNEQSDSNSLPVIEDVNWIEWETCDEIPDVVHEHGYDDAGNDVCHGEHS